MAYKKGALPASFLETAKKERSKHGLEVLTWEVMNADHSERYPTLKILGMKKCDMGPILIAEGIVKGETYVSLSQYSNVFWWHEGPISKSLLKKIMALPDIYPQALPDTEFSLEEIHQAQDALKCST